MTTSSRAPSGRSGGGPRAARPTSGARAAYDRRRRRPPFRIYLVGIFAMAAVLVGKLVFVQVLNGSSYASYAASETEQKVTLPALRGAVYDRTGDLLAVSVERYDVVADDFLVSDASTDAGLLAPLLHEGEARLVAELSEQSGYVVLARQVSSATEAAITDLGLEGITFQNDPLRQYPTGALFQPVLGGVYASGSGDAGVELSENALLAGMAGSEVVAQDPTGADLPSGPSDVVAAKQGTSVVLTIDEPLQNEVTKDVAAQMTATKADSGVSVVEDVHTGNILAMVDLVRTAKGAVVPAPSNLALDAVYQPGSVMKLATISYSLQDHLITPNTEFTVPYTIEIGGYTFEDADLHGTEELPVKQILAESSNVGTIEISRLLGMNRLAEALKALGFGQYTGLDWPGESPGIVGAPSSWVGSDAGSVPIGTGVAVTPMQVLDAYNAVANDGVFVAPRLVQATVDAAGKEQPVAPSPTRRALEPSTVADLVPMLEGVVCDEDGTAILARIPGYTVAGKTGTAQVPAPNGGGYIPGDWNATFVGFVPAEAPQLSGIVVLNHQGGIVYGGTESAPVFAQIMQYALRHFNIAPPSGVGSSAPVAGSTSCLAGK